MRGENASPAKVLVVLITFSVVASSCLCSGIVGALTASMRSSTPYKRSLELVTKDKAVIDQVGTPMKPGLFVMGKIHTSLNGGFADLSYSIEGPKGKASVHTTATRAKKQWTLTSVDVSADGQKKIVILSKKTLSE